MLSVALVWKFCQVACLLSVLVLQEKMGTAPEEQAEVVRDMVQKYVEGLCWVMSYYYDGAISQHVLPAVLCSSSSQAFLSPTFVARASPLNCRSAI